MDKNALITNDGWLYVDDYEANIDIAGLDAFNIFQEILLKARQKKDVFKGLRKEFADKIQQNICEYCGCYTENDEACGDCLAIERDSLMEQKYTKD